MKHLLFPLLFLPMLSTAQCDTIKRLAATWVIERNNCREELSLAEQEIALLRASDSLTRVSALHWQSAASTLGKHLVAEEQKRKDAEARADRWQGKARRRLWLLPVGVAVGVVIGVVG
jgi:hypothetical protein